MCKEILSTSKVLSTLFPCGASTEVKLQDLPKAFTALRSYGATEKEALDIISNELLILKDYDTNRSTSLAPELLERFGLQHVIDALSYAYLYLEDFELNKEEYLQIIDTLLKVYRPEQLILFPEKIRLFLRDLKLRKVPYPFDDLKEFDNDDIKKMTAWEPNIKA